jgi:hypothetical protein
MLFDASKGLWEARSNGPPAPNPPPGKDSPSGDCCALRQQVAGLDILADEDAPALPFLP